MKQKRGWRDDKRDLYGSRSALGSLYDSNPSRHIIHDSPFYFYSVLLLHILWHKSMRHSYYTRHTCQYLGMSFTMTYIYLENGYWNFTPQLTCACEWTCFLGPCGRDLFVSSLDFSSCNYLFGLFESCFESVVLRVSQMSQSCFGVVLGGLCWFCSCYRLLSSLCCLSSLDLFLFLI
jgi:hypothetical protein